MAHPPPLLAAPLSTRDTRRAARLSSLSRRRALSVLPALALLATLTLRLASVSAHAEIVAQIPQANTVLAVRPAAVRLVFSERVLASLSQVAVTDATGARFDRGASGVSADGLALRIALAPTLPTGPYTVLWTSVSADDGHVLQGSYTFVVGQAGTQIVVPTGSGIAPLATMRFGLARVLTDWVALCGAAIWVGLPLFLRLVLGPALRRGGAAWAAQVELATAGAAARLGYLALGLTLVSTLMGLLLQAASVALATGSPVLQTLGDQALGSRYGLVWIVREVVLLAALAVSTAPLAVLAPAALAGPTDSCVPALPVASGGPAEWATQGAAPWAAALGVVYLALVALNGHAAALFTVLPLSLAVDWLHLLAMAIWLGGTVGVAAAIVPATAALAPRDRARALVILLPAFSPWALGAVAILSVTGMGNAVLRSTDLASWAASAYGRVLAIKILLFIVMAAISRYHAYVLRPRLSAALVADGSDPEGRSLEAAADTLTRWVMVNPYLAAAVLLCVAVMASSPPPV